MSETTEAMVPLADLVKALALSEMYGRWAFDARTVKMPQDEFEASWKSQDPDVYNEWDRLHGLAKLATAKAEDAAAKRANEAHQARLDRYTPAAQFTRISSGREFA